MVIIEAFFKCRAFLLLTMDGYSIILYCKRFRINNTYVVAGKIKKIDASKHGKLS